MVRILKSVNTLPFRPNRFCLKNAGPGEVRRTRIQITAKRGLSSTRAVVANNRSSALFVKRYQVAGFFDGLMCSSRMSVPDPSKRTALPSTAALLDPGLSQDRRPEFALESYRQYLRIAVSQLPPSRWRIRPI